MNFSPGWGLFQSNTIPANGPRILLLSLCLNYSSTHKLLSFTPLRMDSNCYFPLVLFLDSVCYLTGFFVAYWFAEMDYLIFKLSFYAFISLGAYFSISFFCYCSWSTYFFFELKSSYIFFLWASSCHSWSFSSCFNFFLFSASWSFWYFSTIKISDGERALIYFWTVLYLISIGSDESTPSKMIPKGKMSSWIYSISIRKSFILFCFSV